MINKTYPFIVINKNNMTKLDHFRNADLCSLFLCCDNFNPDNWVVIKDEKTVVNLSDLKTVGCGICGYKRKIQEALEKA